MPSISFIVPAYNVADCIERCLKSALSQTLSDIEVVVVNDASTDETAELIARMASTDQRVRLINHEENKGLHLARKTGVAAATGEYLLFLDGDDEVEADLCETLIDCLAEKPADVIHFGVNIVAENGADAAEAMSPVSSEELQKQVIYGESILRYVFDEALGYQQDWRVWQRLFKTPIAKQAFDNMTSDRLERAEDGYECLILLDQCRSAYTIDSYQGYIYHFGLGITGSSYVSAERFEFFCDSFKACLSAAEQYVEAHPSIAKRACLEGLKKKDYDLLANDWLLRVPDADKEQSMDYLASCFGNGIAADQAYRFARDRSYEMLVTDTQPAKDDPLYLYESIADGLYAKIADDAQRSICQKTRHAAKSHIQDLKYLDMRDVWNAQDIRIFVSTHKKADRPASPVFQPVQVGCALRDTLFRDALHDNDGENISEKNARYCELTTQYWAWKNVDAEYYGFCHYRRYFDFSDTRHKENPFGEIIDGFIDEETCERYGLDEASVRSKVEGYDLVTTEFKDLRDFPGKFATPYEHYLEAPRLHIEDIDRLRAIIAQVEPDYVQDADTFFNGHSSCFCNMYIMRKKLFFEYCEWLFPLLDAFDEQTDMSHYSIEALRTPGHLAERLFNIYYLHHKRMGTDWKTNELQCVHFEHPESPAPLICAFDGTAIPVVFAADDNYVPQLSTALYSVVEHISPGRYYDFVVLSRNISGVNQRRMFEFLTAGHPNISLRFFDVSRLVKDYKLEANAHISTETYYRFLIQSVLPDYNKVLYLDSDLVVNVDVADLYDMNLGSNLLAAVRDADYLGNLNMNDGERMQYSLETLHMKDPYAYFQAGVLLLNTHEFRRLHTQSEWLELASVPYLYNDQDILNMTCEGRVSYLDYAWNMMTDTGRYADVISFAPAEADKAYISSRKDPKIIHFAGGTKPWNDPESDFADTFWAYARKTPFYETLLNRMGMGSGGTMFDAVYTYTVNRYAMRSWKRKIADFFLPYGSRRREWFKGLKR